MANANGWSQERRRRQSELIRKWKPWLASTGPRTKRGKIEASQNARKHGLRSAEIRLVGAVIAGCRRFTGSISPSIGVRAYDRTNLNKRSK